MMNFVLLILVLFDDRLQAWGKNSQAAMKGPCLLTLVKHAQAVLKPLAHIHRHRVLHRGLTPDHVLVCLLLHTIIYRLRSS